MSREIKTISVTREFADLAKKNKLSWTEASRIGMSILLAERGEMEYDNKLNLHRKMTFFRTQAENALQKLSELENKDSINSTPTTTDLDKELNKVFSDDVKQ
jgi:hypothetical protein